VGIPVQRSKHLSPWKLDRRGWLAAVKQVWKDMDDDHISLVAGGVAFFGFLALFPAIAAFIAVYGLVFDPAEVSQQIAQLRGVVPPTVLEMVEEQLQRLTATATGSLSWGAVLALVLALWSASKGTRGLIEAINVAYDRKEQRGLVKQYLMGLALTLGSIVFVAVMIALVAGVPAVLALMGLDIDASRLLRWGRWPVLVVLVLLAIAATYFVAPNRETPKWQWVTPGSLLATLGLLAASGVFSLYVTSFGDYDEIYGSVGAVAVFLLWLYLTSFVILIGAELNAALELQVAEKVETGNPDATDAGGSQPMVGTRERGKQQHDDQRPER
jgi:membrane protein